MNARHLARVLAASGALIAAGMAAHAAINTRLVRRPDNAAVIVAQRVSILLPARNEAHRIGATLRALLAQEGIPELEILILDDGSTDGTGDIVHSIAGVDPRVRLIEGLDESPPPGWLGKSWACQRLAQAAHGDYLVFVDADVELTPNAVASALSEMRDARLQLLSPYPRQLALTPAERIIQPLVTWLWMSTLPLRLTERAHYPSMAAANGQFLIVDARAYRISGGHAAVSSMVLEDVGLLRSFKRAGFQGSPADGSAVAQCRMYDSTRDIYDGYTKSLWSAFQPPAAAYAVVGMLCLAYVAPPVFAALGPGRSVRAWGAAGYAAGVLGRYVIARRTGERIWPDVLAQPVSVAAFTSLVIASLHRHRAGTLTWRGRPVP
jgi:hypothetical protein